MSGDEALPPDQGVREKINPCELLIFRNEWMYRSKIDAVRPFDQKQSDGNGEPILIVVVSEREKYVMQGNHRVYGAQEDGIQEIEAVLYTPEQWESSFRLRFKPRGTNNPAIRS